MDAKISLITIWTDDIEKMKHFYRDVLGFKVEEDLGNYIEFESVGVRFALCLRSVMYDDTKEYQKPVAGQSFELAFPCRAPIDVDETYEKLIKAGATPIHSPEDKPWGQRNALFADPDGNIHEIFARIHS